MAEERRRSGDRIADTALNMAREAINEIKMHERVCTERYTRFVENQEAESEVQKERHTENQDAIKQINDRMWMAAGALVTAMVALIMALIFTPLGHP